MKYFYSFFVSKFCGLCSEAKCPIKAESELNDNAAQATN